VHPEIVKDTTREFFSNWTRASKLPERGVRQEGEGLDAKYFLEEHECKCHDRWKREWTTATLNLPEAVSSAAQDAAKEALRGHDAAKYARRVEIAVRGAARAAGGSEADITMSALTALKCVRRGRGFGAECWKWAQADAATSEVDLPRCYLRCRLLKALAPAAHIDSNDWADLSNKMEWDDWVAVLKSFDTGKSSGGSQIRIEAIRALPVEAQGHLLAFINVMMEANMVPALLLEARMATLHKKASEPFGLDNIRPISLLEVVAKIMDKHHMLAINKCLRKKGIILGEMQNAFCPGRGVGIPLMQNELVNEDAARSNGERTAWTCYHDVSKAYDSVEFWAQEIALRRMKLPEFFIDYWREVSRRGTTRVQTKHGLTDEYHIGRGVRQGAVLSPIIFNFFMEPLAALLMEEEPYITAGGVRVNGAIFADDVWNVSATYEGIRRKAETTAYYLCFFGMSMNAAKTHFTATWREPDGCPPPPIQVTVWRKGYKAEDDGEAVEWIPFRLPGAKARYLGLWFTGAGCSVESFSAMNGKFIQAITQMNNRSISYAVASYVMQAVLYTRLGYGMAVAVPDVEDCRKWQSMANRVLAKALCSQGVKRSVLFAERKYGGMGGKSLLRIRDEVVLTSVMALLNGPPTTTAQLLQECLCAPTGDVLYGCGANPGGPPVEGFAARLRGVLAGVDCMLVRRDVERVELRGPTPREALDLEYGSPGHVALRRKGIVEVSQCFSPATMVWSVASKGPGREGLINARSGVAQLTADGDWVLSEESPLQEWVDNGRVIQPAVEGAQAYGLPWLPVGACPVVPSGPAARDVSLWYTDGSMKPDYSPPRVGWAAVWASELPPPSVSQIHSVSSPMGKTGTEWPGIAAAEATGILQAICESPGGEGGEVRIRTDSKACKNTIAKLPFLTTRQWARLACRWIWRQVLANIVAREAAGQKVHIQWVKAHTEGDDVQSLWNDKADHFAKAAADLEAPAPVDVPLAEDRWVLLHERKAVVSDITRFVGRLHAQRATRDLDEEKWLPRAYDELDRMAVIHVTKAKTGVDLQSRAVRLWAKNGLRTIRKLIAMNPDSKLAEMSEGQRAPCPLCGCADADSEHILTACEYTAGKRSQTVANFFSTLSSFGRWGWWGGAEHRLAEILKDCSVVKDWARDVGLRATVDHSHSVPRVTCAGVTAPASVWWSVVQTSGVDRAPYEVRAALRALHDEKKKVLVKQLPRRLADALLSAFSIDSDANAKPYARRGGAAGAVAMVSAASHGLAGRRTMMRVDAALDEHVVRGIVKAIRTDSPTRILMVVAGGLHDSNIIAAVKSKAKVLVTWPSGSVPVIGRKELRMGDNERRTADQCAKSKISLVLWENYTCREAYMVTPGGLRNVQKAALRCVRGTASRLRVRYGAVQGKSVPATFPAALAEASVGFDAEDVRRAEQDHGVSGGAGWGLTDWDLQYHAGAIYRGLLPKGLTVCMAAAGVPPNERRDGVNLLAEGLINDGWNTWRHYENGMNADLKARGLAPSKARQEKLRFRIPPASERRREKEAVAKALTPIFGLTPVTKSEYVSRRNENHTESEAEELFDEIDVNKTGSIVFKDLIRVALDGALPRPELVRAALGEYGASSNTFPVPSGECMIADYLSVTKVVDAVQELEARGRLTATLQSRRVPLTARRITEYMRSVGIQTAHKRHTGCREERRHHVRARRRGGRRALPQGSRDWRQRNRRFGREQAWAQQPALGSSGRSAPSEIAGKVRLGGWNGRSRHLSIEERDVRHDGGPPRYTDDAWVGFTFKRAGTWCTVSNRGDSDVTSTAIQWATGGTLQVTMKELHRAWLGQQRGTSHCRCDECSQRVGASPHKWQAVKRKRQQRVEASIEVQEREAVLARRARSLVPGTRVLARWFGVDSDLRLGWYLATVTAGGKPGTVNVDYHDGDTGADVQVAYVVLRDHEGDDSHMDECFKCGDGGDLLLCDSCNATAHLECAGLSAVPTDEWICGMCTLLRDEAEEESKECAALEHEASRLHADFPSRRDRQQQKRKAAPTSTRQGRERRRRSRSPNSAVSLEGFVKTRVRLPAPWNSAGTLRRLVKGGRAFEVAWDDGTPLCIHDVCEVASWMKQRGDTAWAAVRLPERSCMRTWKWLYALRVRSAGLTWGRCSDPDALVDAMDAAHEWDCPACPGRARAYSPVHGRWVCSGRERGRVTDYRPCDDMILVTWNARSRLLTAAETKQWADALSGEDERPAEWDECNGIHVRAIVSEDSDGALSLRAPERTQWHTLRWVYDLLRSQDGEFDQEMNAATKARSTPVHGGCGQQCVARLFSKSVWSPLRLRDLSSSTLDNIVASRAQTLTRSPSTASAVRLMAAVMATPPMRSECDACCLRAALTHDVVGQVVTAGRPKAVSRIVKRRRRSRCMLARFEVTGYLPAVHKFVLVGVDDEGKQERRIMAERVLDWMGRADSKTREMRVRAMRVSVRGEWECECVMTNRDAVTASRRFWTRAGHGAEFLRAGAGAPKGVGDPGFYGNLGPEGDE